MGDKAKLRARGPRRWWLVVLLAVCLVGAAATAQAASFVYVTNSDGTVSQYAAGAGGLLAPLSPPTVAAGIFPIGVAVSPDGKSVYVAGENNAVFQYDVGGGGALSPKSPPSVYGGLNPRQLAVSPDGKSVYVVDIGQATVSQFDVGAGGALSPKSPPTVVAAGQGLAVNPDGKSVYVLHTSGFLSQFDVGAGGVLSPKSPPTVAAPNSVVAAVVVSPDGKSVYVTGTSSVGQYDVGAGGALSPKSPPTVAAPGAALGAVAASPDGHSVYVSGAGPGLTGIVLQYDVGAGGALSPKSPLTVSAGPPDLSFALAVSADGKSVYVTSGTGFTSTFGVSQYDVGAGGTLSPKSPATVAAGRGPAFGIAVTPLPRVLTTKDQCKHGGFAQFGFKNQGQCVAFVERGPKN